MKYLAQQKCKNKIQSPKNVKNKLHIPQQKCNKILQSLTKMYKIKYRAQHKCIK